MAEESQQRGLIGQLMDDLPPSLRFILLLSLLIPLNLAITGLLLNVNVGKLIEEALDRQNKTQKVMIEDHGELLLSQISTSMKDVVGRIGFIEGRLYALEVLYEDQQQQLDAIKSWACGPILNDGIATNDPEFC